MTSQKIRQDKYSLYNIYQILYDSFGAQHWWPGETVDEIIIGAVLVQNTNWINVTKAIDNLKKNSLLDLAAIYGCEKNLLTELIKPSGYYNIKTKRLLNVAEFFSRHSCENYRDLRCLELNEFRKRLLNINGVGRETADSILLYAFGYPIFVIDAYTMRFGKRHKIFSEKCDYDEARVLFESSLPSDTQLYNEYHALFVRLGKEFCKTKVRCDECPLNILFKKL